MYTKSFEQLSKDELYALMTLRQKVFIVEQQSIYLDLDSYDQLSMHYLEFDDNDVLHTYARYRYIELSNEVKIERVVLAKVSRGTGRGKLLIQTMLGDILRAHPQATITLSSQTDACGFYQKLGFTPLGQPYDDGGILHITMQFDKAN